VKQKSNSGGGKLEARSSRKERRARSADPKRIRYRLIEPGGGTKLRVLPSDRQPEVKASAISGGDIQSRNNGCRYPTVGRQTCRGPMRQRTTQMTSGKVCPIRNSQSG